MSKYARWSFTQFDTSFDYSKLANESSYLIVGKEICPDTKKEHHQCYVEFSSKRYFNGIKKLLPTAHIEASKGGPEANKKYCSKDNNVILEIGTPFKQGVRTDLKKAKEMITSGATLEDIIDEDANYQTMRASELIMKFKEPKRNWKPEVFWYWGPTGCGKTRTAYEEAGDRVWESGKTLKWWDGYDAHEDIIIDDFRPYFCEFAELLRILDRYPYRVEVKGGTRQLRARRIWITCPKPPDKVYEGTSEDVHQLVRRISVIKFFGPEVSGPEVERR